MQWLWSVKRRPPASCPSPIVQPMIVRAERPSASAASTQASRGANRAEEVDPGARASAFESPHSNRALGACRERKLQAAKLEGASPI